MPDITMCQNQSCGKKDQCYLYRAIPSQYRQSYFNGNPNKEDGSCEYFCQIHDGMKLNENEKLDKSLTL